MSEERAIRSVCVAGAGNAGLSAAIAFARALPRVTVSILDWPPAPADLVDRQSASLPTIHRFHSALGLDELELVRAGIATHLLGTRFDNWSADGQPWFHGFAEHGLPAGRAPFHTVWQRARSAGAALPFHCYSAAASIAAAGKFVHPSNDPASPLGTFLYALRLDPELYRARLRAATEGLSWIEGDVGEIERRPDGGIDALRLADGRRIAADLFVDCTGPEARLLSAIAPAFEDWGEWLPCDRLLIRHEQARPPTSCDSVTGAAAGWRWVSPLIDRTLVIEATSSVFAAGPLPEDAVVLRPGRRPEPWVSNVLAIGGAATALDPLYGVGLHLAQSGILRALELLPGRDCHPLELSEYNRRAGQETDRARDFLTLHYLGSGRSDTPFWRAAATRALPESLGRTLEQFKRRGRLPFFEEESFDNDSWLAALLGLGILPEEVDPLATGVDMKQAIAAMADLAARLAALPQRLPAYRDLLARMADAKAR